MKKFREFILNESLDKSYPVNQDDPSEYPAYVFDQWSFEANGTTYAVRIQNATELGSKTSQIRIGIKKGKRIVTKLTGIKNIRLFMATILHATERALENPTTKLRSKNKGIALVIPENIFEMQGPKIQKILRRIVRRLKPVMQTTSDYHDFYTQKNFKAFYIWRKSLDFDKVFDGIPDVSVAGESDEELPTPASPPTKSKASKVKMTVKQYQELRALEIDTLDVDSPEGKKELAGILQNAKVTAAGAEIELTKTAQEYLLNSALPSAIDIHIENSPALATSLAGLASKVRKVAPAEEPTSPVQEPEEPEELDEPEEDSALAQKYAEEIDTIKRRSPTEVPLMEVEEAKQFALDNPRLVFDGFRGDESIPAETYIGLWRYLFSILETIDGDQAVTPQLFNIACHVEGYNTINGNKIDLSHFEIRWFVEKVFSHLNISSSNEFSREYIKEIAASATNSLEDVDELTRIRKEAREIVMASINKFLRIRDPRTITRIDDPQQLDNHLPMLRKKTDALIKELLFSLNSSREQFIELMERGELSKEKAIQLNELIITNIPFEHLERYDRIDNSADEEYRIGMVRIDDSLNLRTTSGRIAEAIVQNMDETEASAYIESLPFGIQANTIFPHDPELFKHVWVDSWSIAGGSKAQKLALRHMKDLGSNGKMSGLWEPEDDDIYTARNAPKVVPSHTKKNFQRIYENTQRFFFNKFGEKYKKKKVKLYRGVGAEAEYYVPGAVESWSKNISTANKFADMMARDNSRPIIMMAEVFLEDVFGTWESMKPDFPPEDYLQGKKEYMVLGGAFHRSPINIIEAGTRETRRVLTFNEWRNDLNEENDLMKTMKIIDAQEAKNHDIDEVAFGLEPKEIGLEKFNEKGLEFRNAHETEENS